MERNFNKTLRFIASAGKLDGSGYLDFGVIIRLMLCIQITIVQERILLDDHILKLFIRRPPKIKPLKY